jgi:hypothetical protein
MITIGTWNVANRTGQPAAKQLELLREHSRLWVVTEPSDSHRAAYASAAIFSQPAPNGRTWVAVIGEGIQPAEDVSPKIHSAAGVVQIDGESIAILGTVLPWSSVVSHAPEFCNGATNATEIFARVLNEQVADLKVLTKHHEHLIWAGDFNQNLWGAYAGAIARRKLLMDALEELRLVPFNAALPHASPGLATIDLLCGTSSLQLESASRIARPDLSDHSAYLVTLELAR